MNTPISTLKARNLFGGLLLVIIFLLACSAAAAVDYQHPLQMLLSAF